MSECRQYGKSYSAKQVVAIEMRENLLALAYNVQSKTKCPILATFGSIVGRGAISGRMLSGVAIVAVNSNNLSGG